MPFFNKIRKLNSVRWLFLSLGIVAVLALTVMNIYSLYALRESTIESAKDNKKSQLDEFTFQVRHQFGGPFRELRKLDIEKLENSWSVSGNFPAQMFWAKRLKILFMMIFTTIQATQTLVTTKHNPCTSLTPI